jgi:predicted TIM-barrel fold metal-dependent hydrolase
MKLEEMILVSVDDHLVEPPDMFDRHLPRAYRDKAPKIVSSEGNDSWVYEGRRLPNIGLNAVAGRPRNEFGCEPTAYRQMRRGCWDVKARIDDMNANGVLGSICFPTLPGFAGLLFSGAQDKQAAQVLLSAYNDWHIHDWCGSAPGRFIPLAILPLWDMDATVNEVRRVVAKGCHTVTFPDNPAPKGLPSIHDNYWDPLWTVLSDHDVAICAHIGTGYAPPHPSMESPIDAWITTMPMSIANAAADWLFASIWQRFPKLRIALSEGGIGWIPYFLERADFTYEHHRQWTNANFGKSRPSEVFNRHFLTCFIDDAFGLRSIDAINSKMVAWECDYPHSDSVWPKSPEYLWNSLKHLGDAQIDDITHLNAMRMFSYDPFPLLGRANCTVGALREQARDVDVAERPNLGGHNPMNPDGRPVTSGQVVKFFTGAPD